MGIGLRFIGVVKTATRQFPMSYLSQLELTKHDDTKGLLSHGPNGEPIMLAFVWMDRIAATSLQLQLPLTIHSEAMEAGESR